MFTLRQIQMFETVARLGSYSRAAEELGVSQPSVSVQVRELENDLGVELFEKGGRRTGLTEAGTSFYAKAVKILAAVEESVVEVDRYLGLERGRVRVGATESIGLYLLPAVIGAYSDAHPGLEVELTLERPEAIVRGLQVGRLDLGLTDRGEEEGSAVGGRRVAGARYVVITGRRHPLALQQRAEATALAEQPYIVEAEASPSFRGLEWLAAGMEGQRPRIAMQVASCDALKQMVRAHIGIAVTYGFCVEWEQAGSQLHILDVSDLDSDIGIYLLSMKDGALGPAAQSLANLIGEMLSASRPRGRRSQP